MIWEIGELGSITAESYWSYHTHRACHRIHSVPIVTDGVALSVCLLVTFVSPAKTDKPIEMPFAQQYELP